MLIKFDTKELTDKAENLIGAIQATFSISLLAKSPNLPLILGRAAQRRIDSQGYPELTDKYKLVKSKATSSSKILIRTGGLYERLGSGKSFEFASDGNNRINVKLTDPIARGHQSGNYPGGQVRPVLEVDDQLGRELAEEFSDRQQEELRRRLK